LSFVTLKKPKRKTLSHFSCLSAGRKEFVYISAGLIQMTVLYAAFCQIPSATGATAERSRSHTALISPHRGEEK